MMSILSQKWQNISPRERRIVLWGIVALLVIGYYGMILSPLLKERKRLENLVSAEKQLYEQTQQQAQKLANLGGVGKQIASADMPESLRSLSDKYALSSGHFQPLPDSTWQIAFQSVKPNDFFTWLGEIRRMGLSIKQFSITKVEGSPTVQVEIQIAQPQIN